MKVAGGKQTRSLGNRYSLDSGMANTLNTAGITSNAYDGATMSSSYKHSYMQVPIALGLNFRFDKFTAYAGVGGAYFNGNTTVDVSFDSKYAAALATYPGASSGATLSLSPGSVSESIKFKLSGFAINYFFGAERKIIDWLGIFIEFNAGHVTKTVYSEKFSSNFSKLATASNSKTIYQADNEYIKRTTLPVTMGAASIRMGVRFYLL